jgi:long-chain acyl-CoA synthetase
MRIFDFLLQYSNSHPGKVLYQYKREGKWWDITVNQFLEDAGNLSRALLAIGIKKDDKVAIVSANRPEWNLVDFACQFIGAVSVPIYVTLTEEDVAYIFQDAGVKMAFASNEELAQRCQKSGAAVPGFSGVFCFDEVAGFPQFRTLLAHSGEVSEDTLSQQIKSIQSEDLLTLIYTSGTTGRPKGVMLTHHNLASNVTACVPLFPLTHESKSLSFLPLCHIYERMLSYLYIALKLSVAYAESLDTIGENLKEIHPNLFCTVPRLLEKVYDKIVAKGQELRGIKRALFFWALNLGLKYEVNRDLGFWYNFQLRLANKLIFNKWREALGGEVKFIVSGGAALQPRLARVFSAAQIVVMEGYGLTETSPVISVNRYEEENRRIGMVGPVIDGVEVKIAPDGEILTRGPHVMKGYFNKPDLTAEVMDADGWFHTGDIGEFQEGKFLKITDRKKEMFKTSGGKYIAPQLIENKLKESLIIEQAMVIGDGERFPAALLVPSFDGLKEWCRIKEIPFTSQDEMLRHPLVVEKFNREVEKANESLAQYERIKKVKVVPGPWTIEGGEMTPTMKLKRKNLMKEYAAEIEAIYREG